MWHGLPYVFSLPLVFATIPKLEAATHFISILLGGNLTPIVVYLRWGWLSPKKALSSFSSSDQFGQTNPWKSC